MARQHYSDEARAAALAVLDANGGNLARSAKEAAVPRSSLRDWDTARERAAPAELRQKKRIDAAEVYASIRNKASALLDEALDLLTPAAVAADTKLLVAISTVGGTADDKETRARGEPTERIEHVDSLTNDEAIAAARRLRILEGGKAKRTA